jgi:hypothetical protein
LKEAVPIAAPCIMQTDEKMAKGGDGIDGDAI